MNPDHRQLVRAQDRKFAANVAKVIERRRLRKRLLFYLVVALAILLALRYIRFGGGFGLGESGSGAGSGPGSGLAGSATAPARCALRVASTGITVDGKPATKDEAVTACKTSGAADVVVTGDAREGDWTELKAALEAANVTVYLRGTANR